MRLAEYLWLHLGALYGHRWTSAYGDDPASVAGMAWSGALAGMTRGQIDTGLQACAAGSDGWPPSLPEFRRLCLGIPSVAAVRLELRAGHPAPSRFVRGVWQRIDGWTYQRADADKADRMVREAYELTVAAVMRGEALPSEPVGALEHDVDEQQRTCTPEVGRAALDAIDRATRGMHE